MKLLHELQRRKVIRTTAAYLAAAFVVAQAVQLLVDGLELSSWILKAVLIIEAAALPVVVALAWAFDLTAEGVEKTEHDPADSRMALPWRRIALPVTAGALVLFASLAFFSLNRSSGAALNQQLVAVLPFRVSGDPQLAYLGEGMVDLLAAKLTGEGGPRAADPRVVASAAKKVNAGDASDVQAAQIARDLGAGQVLVGTVVGTPAQFQISARLLRTNGGRSSAAQVAGSAATLLESVDRLVAQLLSLEAGEGPQRLELLTTTSLPALRAYLDGRVAFRSGHFGTAIEKFTEATQLDSTFALAALGSIEADGWGEGPSFDAARARRIVWANRDRLGEVDRAIATANIGEPGVPRSYEARLRQWESVLQNAQDRADAWFAYGDVMIHWGALVGRDHYKESDVAFRRALALDSAHMPALLHLIDAALLQGNEPEARRLDQLRKARDPADEAASYQRPIRAFVFRDSAAIAELYAALDTMSGQLLATSVVASVGGLADGSTDLGVKATARLLNAATTDAERSVAWLLAAESFADFGMPARSADARRAGLALDGNAPNVRITQVLSALYDGGDQAAAREAVEALPEALGSANLRNAVRIRCVLEQWRLWHGDVSGYGATSLELARVPADSQAIKVEADVCVQVLATLNAMATAPNSLPARVRALDALMKTGPATGHMFRNASNIALARAAERSGDKQLAYRAIRRLPAHFAGWSFRSEFLREGGRLAALNGDNARAIELYTLYLRLHEQAEPAVRRQDDAVRMELARLTGEGARR